MSENKKLMPNIRIVQGVEFDISRCHDKRYLVKKISQILVKTLYSPYNSRQMKQKPTPEQQREFDKYAELYRLYSKGYTQADIALYMGKSQSAVSQQLKTLKSKYPSLFGLSPDIKIERYNPDYHDHQVKDKF